MAVTYSTAAKNARLSALATEIGSSPTLRIYAGTPPASVNEALSANTLLGQLAMSETPFAAPSNGTMSANAITDDSSADATGTATFFRIVKSDGTTAVVQGTVGTSGADLNLNTTSIVAGGPIQVSSLVITHNN